MKLVRSDDGSPWAKRIRAAARSRPRDGRRAVQLPLRRAPADQPLHAVRGRSPWPRGEGRRDERLCDRAGVRGHRRRGWTRSRSPPTSSAIPTARVALGAARLARNVRRLILYEPAPGVPQVDPELLVRLDALLAEGEREQLLSVFLTEVGLDPDALEQLRASPLWGAARDRRAHRSRVSCGPSRATDPTLPPSRRSSSLRCFCLAARAPSGRRRAPRSSSPCSRTIG
jgi:hypothetical protein